MTRPQSPDKASRTKARVRPSRKPTLAALPQGGFLHRCGAKDNDSQTI
jgi:hypothetical protein